MIKENSKILSIFEIDNLDFFGIVQGVKGTMKTVSSKLEVEHRVKSPGYTTGCLTLKCPFLNGSEG